MQLPLSLSAAAVNQVHIVRPHRESMHLRLYVTAYLLLIYGIYVMHD